MVASGRTETQRDRGECAGGWTPESRAASHHRNAACALAPEELSVQRRPRSAQDFAHQAGVGVGLYPSSVYPSGQRGSLVPSPGCRRGEVRPESSDPPPPRMMDAPTDGSIMLLGVSVTLGCRGQGGWTPGGRGAARGAADRTGRGRQGPQSSSELGWLHCVARKDLSRG